MEKENIVKFLSAITAVITDGQLVVKDKVATISHSDIANIAMIRCTSAFDAPDGTYGLEFDRLLTGITSAKTKTLDLSFGKSDYTVTYEKTKIGFAQLNLGTLPSIRPKLEIQFPCEVDLSKDEFSEVISVMEKNLNAQKNDIMKLQVTHCKDGVKFRVDTDSRNFIEREVPIIKTTKGADETFVSYYPMDYVINISSALKKLGNTSITLCFGNDMPIMIKAGDEVVDVEYFIAQRVDAE